MHSFNLIDKPWIVAVRDGAERELSLREVLVHAHELHALGMGEPLQFVALLRQVLLPVLLDALGPARSDHEWASRWKAPAFDVQLIEDYLERHRDRFDLFHAVHPFGQVAGLRTAKNETKPVSLLIPSLASGNNVPLFSSRSEADPPALSPAQAARALLAAQCWDTAAIKSGAVGDEQVAAGKTTGNPTGPLGQLGIVLLVGATVKETLLLNMMVMEQGLEKGDSPWWREDHPTPEWKKDRVPRGVLDVWTWQARRIRLVPEDVQGQVWVRQVVVAAGHRMAPVDERLEWHTAWRRLASRKPGDPKLRAERHVPGRSIWQGFSSLLQTNPAADDADRTAPGTLEQMARLSDRYLPRDLPLQVLTVGVLYGNQSAVVEDVITDVIPLPLAALSFEDPVHGFVLQVVAEAELLRRAVNHLEADLRAAAGAEKKPWDKGQHPGELLIHRLGVTVRRLLRGLQIDPDRIEDADRLWATCARQAAWEIADPMLEAVPGTVVLGRKPDKDKSFRVSAGTAEQRFRAMLNEILGPSDRGEFGQGKTA